MSREKLLSGIIGALAAVIIILSITLLLMLQSERSLPAEETSGQDNVGEAPDGRQPSSEMHPVAQAGNVILFEDEFMQGLRETYGKEYVHQWLTQTVVRLEAQALGINISRSQIDAELARMQIGYDNKADFFRVMEEQLGLSEEDLRNDALQRLMLEMIATKDVTVTEADVEKYIRENPEEFALQHDIRYALIVVGSEEDALNVLNQLAQGVDFHMLARDVSLDEATASEGGDSGWVSVDDPFIPDEISDVLSSLSVGDVSPPFRLDDENGWAIVTLLGRRSIDPLDDSSVREDLKRELALSRAPSLVDIEAALLEKYNAVDFLKND